MEHAPVGTDQLFLSSGFVLSLFICSFLIQNVIFVFLSLFTNCLSNLSLPFRVRLVEMMEIEEKYFN